MLSESKGAKACYRQKTQFNSNMLFFGQNSAAVTSKEFFQTATLIPLFIFRAERDKTKHISEL